MPVPRPPVVPRATVRLQLREGFGFDEVLGLVPYFAKLGFSHVYASPFLKARPGSTHGYDVTDPNAFNPEIGDEASFDRFVGALHAHDMGLVLDFVPNHVGVHGADNPWWLDVLEWGRASPYARFFDIDWEGSARGPTGKVLLPLLGDHYGVVLENGELQLRFDAETGTFSVWYHEHRFPLNPHFYAELLGPALDALGADAGPLAEVAAGFEPLGHGDAFARQEAADLKDRLAALAAEDPAVPRAIEEAIQPLNGTPGRPWSFRALHRLLSEQAYRLAFWRVAADEINYRRFFDINDLAAIRMERSEVFEATHGLVLRLLAEDKVQGLRLDHVDGLFDPAGYCERLQRRAAQVLPEGEAAGHPGVVEVGQPIYLLVEKILARFENLAEDWPVAGTTGYEFMNLVNGLFVDPAAEQSLTNTYHRAIQREPEFAEVVVEAKRYILENNLSSELQVLAYETHRLAQQSLMTRDYTLAGLREALIEIIAHFPVYRTYVTPDHGPGEEGRRYLDWAVARARRSTTLPDTSVFDFLYKMLSTDLLAERGRGYRRADIINAAMRAQQLTSPVTAKSVEDTAFYRYVRLASLNEVGGEPDHFGVSPAAFHHANRDRLRRHPHSMLATATHDHKRGEDTRARIDALSEMPLDWRQRVQRWFRYNRFKRREIDGRPAPGRNDEYLLYQMLLGAWPLDLDPADAEGLAAFTERMLGYMTKATREAKQRTSWIAPNAEYEEALEGFVRAILDPRRNAPFLADLAEFQARTAVIGAVNGLAQTLLRLTAPGVPDTYQGCELWDLSLVDPDNRRPPDYDLRRRFLDAPPAAPGELVADWKSGRIKQHVMARALDHRRRFPALYGLGDYEPVEAEGLHADRVVAFLRRHDGGVALAVAPRLVRPLLGDGADKPMPPPEVWGDTALRVPALADTPVLTDVLTGAERRVPADGGGLRLADVLSAFPVALLAAPA